MSSIPMPRRATVLVLLATRDGERFLERQLASVLSQDGVDVRVTVRDDGSTDGTRALVAARSALDPRVTLMDDHAPSGSASANFFALIHAADLSGVDYVSLCDQDDEWMPSKLQRALAAMTTSCAQGYSAAVRAEWPDGRSKRLAQSPALRDADYLFEGAGQGCTFVLQSSLFARLRAMLDEHRPLLAELHFHDWALYALARAQSARWHFDPEPTMLYRQHGGNDTGARNSGGGIARRLALIRSGWYRAQVLAVTRLVHAVDPANDVAARWLRLTGDEVAGTMRDRAARACFVARHGRRRGTDRCIQVAAAALGYL
jgi:rhamnosyltransferase